MVICVYYFYHIFIYTNVYCCVNILSRLDDKIATEVANGLLHPDTLKPFSKTIETKIYNKIKETNNNKLDKESKSKLERNLVRKTNRKSDRKSERKSQIIVTKTMAKTMTKTTTKKPFKDVTNKVTKYFEFAEEKKINKKTKLLNKLNTISNLEDKENITNFNIDKCVTVRGYKS